MPSIRPRRPRSRPSRPRPSRPRPSRSRSRRPRSRPRSPRPQSPRRLRSRLQRLRRGWRFEEFNLEPLLELIIMLRLLLSAKAGSNTIPTKPVTAISAKAKKRFFFILVAPSGMKSFVRTRNPSNLWRIPREVNSQKDGAFLKMP